MAGCIALSPDGAMASSPAPKTLTLSLPADVHEALVTAAKVQGWTPESLAVDAIADRLESAIRYRVLIERMGTVDQALLDIASFVGDASAAADAVTGAGGLDMAALCRYKGQSDKT